MPEDVRYKAFVAHKHAFFSRNHHAIKGSKIRLEKVKQAAKRVDHGFVHANKELIEAEFNHLLATLKKGEQDKKYWLDCYYWGVLLQDYYAAYYGPDSSQVKEILRLKNSIKKAHQKGALPADPPGDESFLEYFGAKAVDTVMDLVTTPAHLSKTRDRTAYLHVQRIYFTLCRLTVIEGLKLLQDKQFPGTRDVDSYITNWSSSNDFFYGLSVALPAARLLVDLIHMVKHTLFPTGKEKSLHWSERLGKEVYDRHARIINDIDWITLNVITNYPHLLHLTAKAAGLYTLFGMVAVDIGLVLWKWHLAREEYREKRKQYEHELSLYANKPDRESLERAALVRQQMQELDFAWEVKNSTFKFTLFAAVLVASGFGFSLLFAPGTLGIVLCYAVCMTGVGMYLSEGAYAKYKEKQLSYERTLFDVSKDDVKNLARQSEALAEYENAQYDLVFAMVKNTLMPALILGVGALCWQGALAITLVYGAYELGKAIYNCYKDYEKTHAPDPVSPVAGFFPEYDQELSGNSLSF